MDLVLLLNKLNNEAGFNLEFFWNPSCDINRSLSNIGSVIPQVGCSAESFERVGKRARSKKHSVNVTRTFNRRPKTTIDDCDNSVVDPSTSSTTPNNNYDECASKQSKTIVNIDKIKRKPTIILDKIPAPRVILPKTILFDIDNGNIENLKKRNESLVANTVTPSLSSLEDNYRLYIDPLDVF